MTLWWLALPTVVMAWLLTRCWCRASDQRLQPSTRDAAGDVRAAHWRCGRCGRTKPFALADRAAAPRPVGRYDEQAAVAGAKRASEAEDRRRRNEAQRVHDVAKQAIDRAKADRAKSERPRVAVPFQRTAKG